MELREPPPPWAWRKVLHMEVQVRVLGPDSRGSARGPCAFVAPVIIDLSTRVVSSMRSSQIALRRIRRASKRFAVTIRPHNSASTLVCQLGSSTSMLPTASHATVTISYHRLPMRGSYERRRDQHYVAVQLPAALVVSAVTVIRHHIARRARMNRRRARSQ